MSLILALDQGTSSSRAIIYNEHGQAVASAQQTFDLILPREGWVELDPEVIWSSVIECAKQALAQLPNGPAEVAAIGITNQRETTLVWERESGRCIYNAIVWQDTRSAERCRTMQTQRLGERALEEVIHTQTGLLIDPYFSSTKLAWILENVEGAAARAAAGELCFGTVDTYLVWRLTRGTSHVTDATNASRTQLFDIHSQTWSDELLAYFAIPRTLLPEVKDSVDDFGTSAAEIFGRELPIAGIAGDQQAALIGQGCFNNGQTKSTYGTGCFVMANTGATPVQSTQKLLTTVAYRWRGVTTYALEGSIFVAGVGVKWLRDGLELIDVPADTEAAFDACGGDTSGVYFVPAFTGLGAPYWQPRATGLITGLTLDTTRSQVVTALVQAIGFQTEELLRAMREDGAVVDELRVDGGMVVNDHLCQFVADVLNLPVLRPADVETTAMGAAVLAGVGAGIYPDLDAAAKAWRLDRRFEPDMQDQDRRKLLAGYAQAVKQVLAPITRPITE